MNYVKEKELHAYWVNTSDNALIYDNLENSTIDVFNDLETLFNGKEIKKEISPFFTFEELSKFDGIWQLMVYSGYLKISEKLGNDEYSLKIPNYEIQTFFRKGFIDKFLVSENQFNPMMRALLDGNIKAEFILFNGVSNASYLPFPLSPSYVTSYLSLNHINIPKNNE